MLLQRLRQFMYGRYGTDRLNIALLVVYFLLNLLLPSSPYVLRLIPLAILAWSFYRILSRNIYARRHENEVFMQYFNRVAGVLVKWNNRLKDTSHKYAKCPTCRQTLRLPKGRGKLNVTCPKCGSHFSKRT